MECDSIINDLYQWFKLSAARRKNYKEIQKLLDIPEHTFYALCSVCGIAYYQL